MHLAHRILGGPSIVGRAGVFEDGLLRLARLLLLERLVGRVVLTPPLPAHAVVPEELVVIRRGSHLTAQIAEVLDQQVTRAVLANLEVVAAGVDAAEDPWKPGDQQIVLRDVSPHLLTAQPAGREALEVFRAPERILLEQFRRERIEPLLGGHGALSRAEDQPARIIAGFLDFESRPVLETSHLVARASIIPSMTSRIRVGTGGGLWELDGDQVCPVEALTGRSLTALAVDGARAWAIVGGRTLWECADSTWTERDRKSVV